MNRAEHRRHCRARRPPETGRVVVVGSFSINHLLVSADRYREAVTRLFASGHEITPD